MLERDADQLRRIDGRASAWTARATDPEIMDRPDVDPAELESALRFIRLVNRYLGGSGAAIASIRRWTTAWPRDRTLHILDLGTGSADIPVALSRWATRRGLTVRVTAVDLHERTIAAARRHVGDDAGIEILRADALDALDRFGPRSFDVVHAGMFLHHLSDDQAIEVLRQMNLMARVGAIWNDLSRGWWPRVGIRLLTLFAPPMVRHDAIVSVEKGFTRNEAMAMAREAGWTDARHRTHLFGRFTVITTPGGEAR